MPATVRSFSRRDFLAAIPAAAVLARLPAAGMGKMPGPEDDARDAEGGSAPVGCDYEYTLLQVEPNPGRHPALAYLGGDPFVTRIVDRRPQTRFGGYFRIPEGATQLKGMAVKVSREGYPGPLEIRLGTSEGRDDLGVARIAWQEVLPLYEPWIKACIAPRAVQPGDTIHFEVRGTEGESPSAHYVVYGPRPLGATAPSDPFGLAYRVLTDRPQDDVDQPGKAYAFQHVREMLGPYYADDPGLRLDGQPPASGETAIETGWVLHFTPDPEQIVETAAKDLAAFLSLRAGIRVELDKDPAPPANRWIALHVSDDPELLKAVTTDEGYRVEVRDDRIRILGRTSRGVMRGVYYVEDLLRLRGAACLARGTVDRNCRFRQRITCSISVAELKYTETSHPLVYTDGLLQRISHQGFNGVWLHLNLEEIAHGSKIFPELDDPEAPLRFGRLRDLVNRAQPLGIDVNCYFATNYHHWVPDSFYGEYPECRGVGWGNALCTSHPLVQQYLEEMVGNLFREVPGLGGLSLIFESEGFWHCGIGGSGPKVNCPRCRDRKSDDIAVEFITIINRAMKAVDPQAELIVWSYGGHSAPPWVSDAIGNLPKDVLFQSEFSKGTKVVRDSVTNYTEDYNISTIGPPDGFVRHYELAKQAGLGVMTKTEHAVSQEFITVPYIPCLRQWHDRAAKMAEFALDGFYGNWCHYGYTPSRPAEILMWYSWTEAPPLAGLLPKIAARDFGPGAAEHALRAWEHFTLGIQAFPYSDPVARYPGPLQKGPSQPLWLDPKAQMPGGARSWQNNLDWTRPWGPDLTANYFGIVEREFRTGIEELEKAKAVASERGRRELDAEIGVAETIARSVHSMINLIAWVPVRDAYAKAGDEADRDRLRKQLAAIAEDELANARAALGFLEADSRLGCTSEAIGSRRGGLFSPALVRTKIGMLEDLLAGQLAPDS